MVGGDKHSPPKYQREKRARTLSPPPPRTVEQPQACTISRIFMAAPLQRQTQSYKCMIGGGKHSALFIVQEAETSKHLESAPASHRGAAASLHDEASWRLRYKAKPPVLRVRDRRRQALST